MELTLVELTGRLALAAGLGVAVGVERDSSARGAGARTDALVSLGAALFTVAGLRLRGHRTNLPMWTQRGSPPRWRPGWRCPSARAWPLRDAELVACEESLLVRAGFDAPGEPPLVRFAGGVDARLGPPRLTREGPRRGL